MSDNTTIITTTDALTLFCERAKDHEYITIDTEFLRESTYFAQLCLVQIAYPGEGPETSAVVDVLAEGIDLTPMMELFKAEGIVKVFHAARQDLEILFHDFDLLPTPFFDTQIAAMVAGFGEQVGYETLVKSICKGKVDKSNRFTDWRKRPLSQAQIDYARADVTYLRDIYVYLRDKLIANDRMDWVEQELAGLVDPELYKVRPAEQWRRVRTRTTTPKFLAIVQALAEFRENYALEKNVPRTRVFKDDALLEIAAQKAKSENDLNRLRLWPRDARKGPVAEGAIQAIQNALKLDPSLYPRLPQNGDEERASESLTDLLRVLLKAQSDRNKVASKLICTSKELDAFAINPNGDHPINEGWRLEIFGQLARDLIDGKIALRPKGKYVETVEVEQ